jgi:hypothetical protein
MDKDAIWMEDNYYPWSTGTEVAHEKRTKTIDNFLVTVYES